MRLLLGLMFGIVAVLLVVMGLTLAIVAAAPYIALGLVAVGATIMLFKREDPPAPPPRADPIPVYDDPHWTRLLPPTPDRNREQ